jgi:hypothetical protein
MIRRKSWSEIRAILSIALLAAGVPAAKSQNGVTKLLVGDAKITVLQKYNGLESLQKPVAIVLHPFSVPEDVITIDRSPVAHILGNGPIAHMKGDAGRHSDPEAVANDIEQTFVKSLMKELGPLPIPTSVAENTPASAPQPGTLEVRGEFTAVQQGNETARVMIGFGRGASDVQAHVIASLMTSKGPIVVAEFNLNSESGKKPGAAATMGVGSAATSVAASGATAGKGSVEGDTLRMAKATAKEIESIMLEQSWIPPDAATIKEVAEKAYIYAYPLVLLSATESVMPVNRLTHVSAFPDASFRLIVRPNADTLYSTAWLDLSKEPLLLHVPDSGGRFYLLQFMDAWTETFADPGKRTTGTTEAWFALTGPGWNGKLPEGVVRYEAPTNHVWLLGRTQTNGSIDYEKVHAFQDGMSFVPLSQYPGAATAPSLRPNMQHPAGLTPPERVKAMDSIQFFKLFAEEMKTDPPHAADAPILRSLSGIGLVPGQDFDTSRFNQEQLAAIDAGVQAAKERLESFVASAGTAKPGWTSFQGVIGRYGTDYVARAVTARVAIGANPAEDAVYMSSSADADGTPLNAKTGYRMHFASDSLPPVQAFWSVTAYDSDGYFIANPLSRYAIGDRDQLKFNPDGSLDLYIQGETPGADREANWLPVGTGPFNLTIRLYWPKQAVLSGAWHPPALERLR